jgi:hypothetical protein
MYPRSDPRGGGTIVRPAYVILIMCITGSTPHDA